MKSRNLIKKSLLLIGSIPVMLQSQGQDSVIHSLLLSVRNEQVQHPPFFLPGILPGYFKRPGFFGGSGKDNTIFLTALAVNTLQTIKSRMTQFEIILADSIIRDAVNIFPRFKNRSGYSTYNFWRTDTISTFPFYWWMRFFRKKSLPDDPDCTAVCWSVSGGPPEYLQRTHEELQLAAVKKVQDKTRSLSTYSIFPAYACWMGNDYPPVTDICTLCNILSFVQIYHLPWSATDTASLDLILAIIRNEDHLEKPEIVSPYYGQPAFILYQLAGLMQVQPIEKLEAMKEKLVADAFRLWTRSKDPLERTVLSTALIKWGVSSKMLAGEATSLRIEKTRWSLMTANGKATAGFFAKLLMGMGKIGKFDYYCPAYNKVLLLENLILRRSNLSERDPSVN